MSLIGFCRVKRSMNHKKVVFILVALVFAVLGIFFGVRHSAQQNAGRQASTLLWNTVLPDAHGAPQALAQWKGNTLLVNFWAPWCAPCVQEMPELSALQAEIGSKNIRFIGIGIDSVENINRFATQFKIAYPLYVAGMPGVELSAQFGNRAGGLPYTVLISQDGRVIKTYLGRLKMAELRSDLLTHHSIN